MGCVNSKRANATPVLDYSFACPPPKLGINDRSSRHPPGSLQKYNRKERYGGRRRRESVDIDKEEVIEDPNGKKLNRRSSGGLSGPISLKLGFSKGNVGAELIAAGWPTWLTSAAAEAVHGWVPLKADAFQKLEKIGQGTYSSVFRAREIATSRMVALKKVRFDNFQPESIRFMAREILILRRLDHPNIMKLEGIITSRLSGSVYLVFEYMEHDLAGLSTSPDIKFSESQIKCYIKQLLCGIEHCHLRGVMHRDIKVSNILVNNHGVLKIGDFGLANVVSERNKHQLTSRVVTLWYRPPELLMGSTSYGVSVDLWSIGCVIAELFTGKPLFKGRTEVEQLHKIFRLCGSPSEEYWKQSKLPNATMFRPQHLYESSLRQRCKDYPTTAVDLIETLLLIEPEKRGTATSALLSQYFNTAPYACDPSSLPKYSPNKEMDAKYRDDMRRKAASGKMRGHGAPRKPKRVNKTLQEQNNFNKYLPKEAKENTQFIPKASDCNKKLMNGERVITLEKRSSFDTILEISQATEANSGFSGPAPVTASTGFAWAKLQQDDNVITPALSCDQSISLSQISELDSSRFNFANSPFRQVSNEGMMANPWLPKQRNRFDSFDASNIYYFYDSKVVDEANAVGRNLGDYEERKKLEFSGPLLTEAYKMDEILQRNENQIRQATRTSRSLINVK